MAFLHKNKTFTTLLAIAFGGVGLHRFYLHGLKDKWGWAHCCAIPLALLLFITNATRPALFSIMPLVLSIQIAFIEALVIGLTPDDQWDAKHNIHSSQQSTSGWLLALLLVLTLGIGTVAVIATLARSFDLLYTGGAYG